MEPGLEVTARFRPPGQFTWSNAAHACTVEVDPATGMVKILRYIVSEDCGRMINPMVVEGQIAGGVVQGIGGVLFEHMVYDDAGNPLATTFLDYLLPSAPEIPDIEFGHIETLSAVARRVQGDGRRRCDRLAACAGQCHPRRAGSPRRAPDPTSRSVRRRSSI